MARPGRLVYDTFEPLLGGEVADYYSVLEKAVTALDLNTERARRRLYERARAALRSEMHSAYPPFRQSEIAAAEMSLEEAIEAVEAKAVRGQDAKSATIARSSNRSVTPAPPGSQSGKVGLSLATLWTDFLRRRDGGAPGREAMPDHRQESNRRTWVTELLVRASRGADDERQDSEVDAAPVTTHPGRVSPRSNLPLAQGWAVSAPSHIGRRRSP
jgi:hypothetical protein